MIPIQKKWSLLNYDLIKTFLEEEKLDEINLTFYK